MGPARVLVIEHVVQLLTVVHGRVRRIPFTDPPVSSMSLAGSRARGQIIDARNSQIVWFSSSGWRLRPLERAHGWSACGARPKDRAVASQVSKRDRGGCSVPLEAGAEPLQARLAAHVVWVGQNLRRR
jgi:hypothetical protein